MTSLISKELPSANDFAYTSHETFNDVFTVTKEGYYPICVINVYNGGGSTASFCDMFNPSAGQVEVRVVTSSLAPAHAFSILWVKCES